MTQPSPAPRGTAPVPLPILDTVGAAYEALWAGRDDALRLAAVPAAVFVALNLFISWQLMSAAAESAAPDLAAVSDPMIPFGIHPWMIALSVLGLIPATLFSCNWQRALLLGGAAAPGLGLRWGLRETRFLGTTILIGVAMMVTAFVVAVSVLMVFHVIGMVLGIVQGASADPGTPQSAVLTIAAGLPVVVAEIYVAIRLVLALPATAIDGSDGFRRAWRLTRGNVARIFVALLLVVLPFYIGAFVFEFLLGKTGLFRLVPFTGTLVAVLIGFVLSAAGAAALSVVYRRLGGMTPGSNVMQGRVTP